MGRWLDVESNPWGQEVLQGISLELMYLAIALAVLFVFGHMLWYRSRGFSEHEETADVQGSVAGIPERIVRHTLPSRIFTGRWQHRCSCYSSLRSFHCSD